MSSYEERPAWPSVGPFGDGCEVWQYGSGKCGSLPNRYAASVEGWEAGEGPALIPARTGGKLP